MDDAITLDQLPIECQHLIFEYLDLVEVANCRLISKKLNEVVKAFRVRELLLYSSVWYRRSSWFHDSKPLYHYNAVSNRQASILGCNSFDLQYLQRLSLFDIVESDKFRLEAVNRFEHLVQLELSFETKEWSIGSETKHLKLRRLEMVFIYCKFRMANEIEFDTPKLDLLALEYQPSPEEADEEANKDEPVKPIESIRFTTPSTVRELITFELFPDELPTDFTGVEHFQCDVLELELDYVLKTFPRLKVLDIRLEKGEFEQDCNTALTKILEQRSQLKPQLKIWFQGFELINGRALSSYAFDKESELALLLKHHSSLPDSGRFPVELSYNELLSLLPPEGYPPGFLDLQPFANTAIVSTNDKIDDPATFLTFLLNCVNLWSLQLKNCSLDQQFFEKLPEFTSLMQLEIRAANAADMQLDFNRFLFRITNLVDFKTDQNLEVDLVRDLMQRLIYLYSLDFQMNEKSFSVDRLENELFLLGNYEADHIPNFSDKIPLDVLLVQLVKKANEEPAEEGMNVDNREFSIELD